MVKNIWDNDTFWFRLSIIAVAVWLVISMTIVLIAYFSWAHHSSAFKELLMEFSTWFFLLPSIGIFGLLNSVPFVAPWLQEALDGKVDQRMRAPLTKDSYNALAERLKAEALW